MALILSFVVSQLLQAAGAQILPLELEHIPGAVAKDAARPVFAQDDRGALHVDLQRVLFGDVQRASEFNWKYDPAQFIHFPYNASRFHNLFSSAVPFQNFVAALYIMTYFTNSVNHMSTIMTVLLQINICLECIYIIRPLKGRQKKWRWRGSGR